MERSVIGERGKLRHRVRELEARNEALEDVLTAARRMLRTRTTLDDKLIVELDRAVVAADIET